MLRKNRRNLLLWVMKNEVASVLVNNCYHDHLFGPDFDTKPQCAKCKRRASCANERDHLERRGEWLEGITVASVLDKSFIKLAQYNRDRDFDSLFLHDLKEYVADFEKMRAQPL